MLSSLAERESLTYKANLETRSTSYSAQLLFNNKADRDKGRKSEPTSYRQAKEVFEARLKHFSKTTSLGTAKDPFLRPGWEAARHEMQDEGLDGDVAHNMNILTKAKRCFHSSDACGRFSVSTLMSRATLKNRYTYHRLLVRVS